jgi:predicted dehydrogenase|tara:strand:- start:16620 stop:17597 length:978 start_codon:yes stop_codon:yes gene_type:complete
MSYSTLIIGLGQIGMDYDYNQDPKSKDIVLTHAQAISTHIDFELQGGVDTRIRQREKFTQKFNRPAYKNISDAFSACDYDVVVISVPTDRHLELCKTVISKAKPKLILLEKPLAHSSQDSLAIIELSQTTGVPIAINYFRAYEPEFVKVCTELRNGLLGFPLTAVVRYTDGMINNGSHWVQFISSFLGDVKDVELSSYTQATPLDFNGDVKISFINGTAYFIPFYKTEYYLFEIDVYGPLGKISIDSSGNNIKEYLAQVDPSFPNLKILGNYTTKKSPNMKQYQKFIYDEIASLLGNKEELSCSSESLRTTVEIYSQLERQLGLK